MLRTELALRTEWDQVLEKLDVQVAGSVIVGGPLAERFGASIPFAVVDEVSGLVSLGAGPMLDPDSTVVDSGLPDASVDAVVMVDAWRTHRELRAVVRESKRIVRPGGKVWLASLNIEGLTNATPVVRPSALFYASGGRVSAAVDARNEVFAATELELLRAGLTAIETWPADLPVAAFETIDQYVDAVRTGMWPGAEALDMAQWSDLVIEIRRSLAGADMPVVERKPWLLASAIKSG